MVDNFESRSIEAESWAISNFCISFDELKHFL